MTRRRQLYLIVVAILCVLLVIIFSSNLYLINWLTADSERSAAGPDAPPSILSDRLFFNETHGNNGPMVANQSSRLQKVPIQTKAEMRVLKLRAEFKNKNPRYFPTKRGLARSFGTKNYNISTVWKIASGWIAGNEIFPQKDERIGKVIKALQDAEIRKARNTPRGTQLKLVFELPGKQSVLFKPSWYLRNTTITGPVYSGKDRHNSEIVAFHLAAVLNLRWTPIVVGRKVSLASIYQLADEELKETMMKNNTSQCVYGKCYYCKESEAVCDSPETGMLEGAVLLLIAGKFPKLRSPWQRTYKKGVAAVWETTDAYCATVKEKLPLVRLLDLIDVAIFDFLIQNGDRHHYETREDRVLLMDNGKGFGNPNVDHFDILAPLYQCCIVRKSTWDRLLMFSGGALTETLLMLSEIDLLHPLLTKEHYLGIERRLLLVYATIELCKEKYGSKIFK